MFFMKEQLPMNLQAFPIMLTHAGNKKVESDPVDDAGGDESPSDSGRGEPRGGFARGGGGAAGGGDPGGDDGEDVCDGEEDGGCEADEGVHEGFLAPFAAFGEAEVDESQAEEGAEETVDAVAI